MTRPAVPLGGPDQITIEDEDQKRSDNPLSRSGPSTTIATISKSRSSQLRVSISEWRGQRRAEIREATALIPTVFFPTSAGVSIDVRQLPALIKGLQSASAEARERGWIK